MNGKVLCLQGGCEHQDLKLSQFTFGKEDHELLSTGQKNRSGSYKDKAGNNIIKHFSDSSLGEKCYVQSYIRKLPPKVEICIESPRTPLDENACWFTLQACGRNLLGSVVKSVSVCEQAAAFRQYIGC